MWEQYDAKSGEGRRSHPFTGWTSLVVLSAYACYSFLPLELTFHI